MIRCESLAYLRDEWLRQRDSPEEALLRSWAVFGKYFSNLVSLPRYRKVTPDSLTVTGQKFRMLFWFYSGCKTWYAADYSIANHSRPTRIVSDCALHCIQATREWPFCISECSLRHFLAIENEINSATGINADFVAIFHIGRRRYES